MVINTTSQDELTELQVEYELNEIEEKVEEKATSITLLRRMVHNHGATVILFTTFAFFFFFRPAEPFLFEYFIKERGFSSTTVISKVFPIWSYATPLAQLIMTFLCEIIPHKWIILFGLLCKMLTDALVILPIPHYNLRLGAAMLSEITIAFGFASHQAFFGLRYHVVDKPYYQPFTSLTRAGYLSGIVIGNLVGQFLYFLMKDNLLILMTITFCCTSIPALIVIWCFPLPNDYIIKKEAQKQSKSLIHAALHPRSLWQFLKGLINAFMHFKVLFYSIFVVFTTAVHQLALTYYQPYFHIIYTNSGFNGFLLAIAYSVAVLATQIPSLLSEKQRQRSGYYATMTLTFFLGILLLWMGYLPYSLNIFTANNTPPFYALVVATLLFVAYHVIYEGLLVFSNAQIASALPNRRFAGTLSFNSFIQNMLQLFLQLLIGRSILNLASPLKIFVALGLVMCSVAILLSLLATLHWGCVCLLFRHPHSKKSERFTHLRDGLDMGPINQSPDSLSDESYYGSPHHFKEKDHSIMLTSDMLGKEIGSPF